MKEQFIALHTVKIIAKIMIHPHVAFNNISVSNFLLSQNRHVSKNYAPFRDIIPSPSPPCFNTTQLFSSLILLHILG